MNKSLLNKKIPTKIGLIILCLLLGTTIFLLGGKNFLNLRASPSTTPAIVRIANISSSSFTVSFSTAAESIGSITYGESKNPDILAKDDRDNEDITKPHRLHYFTVNNLKPNTKYYFTLLSDNEAFDDNGEPYAIKTSPSSTPSDTDEKVIAGKVILPDGSYPKEGAIYAQIGNSQLLSTVLNQDGSYRIVVKNLLAQDLRKLLTSDNDTVNLTIVGDGRQATATIRLNDASSTPTITLSQTYDFASSLNNTEKISTNAAKSTIPKFSSQRKSSGKLEILIPEENQTFNDPQPELSGNALSNTPVTISIDILEGEEIINEEVMSDTDGHWSLRPETPLTPGIYILSVSAKNSTGIIEGIVRSFGINATGSQFTDPSVAPKKSPTPTISPTNTPSVTTAATPSPTVFVPSPTTIIPTQTLIPSSIVTNIPSPHPSLKPGSSDVIISIGLLTFVTLVSAMLFFSFRV